MEIKKTAPAPVVKQSDPDPAPSAETKRVYKLGSEEFQNFITPHGHIVTFYQGYYEPTGVDDTETFVKSIPGVKIVNVPLDFKVGAPGRNISSVQVKRGMGDTTNVGTISHLELLQRAVASSNQTPQAQESNSTK